MAILDIGNKLQMLTLNTNPSYIHQDECHEPTS